jgi:hypothetical protein
VIPDTAIPKSSSGLGDGPDENSPFDIRFYYT